MPPNTSATGGPLLPGPGRFHFDFVSQTDPRYWTDSTPIDGVPLEDFYVSFIRGLTNLPNGLVRPWIQPEPSPLPPWGTNWISIGITVSDLFRGWAYHSVEPPPAPANWIDPPSQGTYLIQHEHFDLLCATYGPNADFYDGLIRDGFMVGQNNELLLLTAQGLVRVGPGRLVPELIQQRWWRRVDRVITINREIRRLYPVLEVLESRGIVVV